MMAAILEVIGRSGAALCSLREQHWAQTPTNNRPLPTFQKTFVLAVPAIGKEIS